MTSMRALPGWAGTAGFVLSLILTGLAAAQEQPRAPSGALGSGAVAMDGAYKIGPDDVLDIAVWNNATVSRAVPVRPDGKISLPLLNDVPVAGLTPMQLRDVLTKKLAEFMPSPEVSVIVREVRSFNISVVGEIRNPGRYELKGRTTVLDALARAGPFNDFASRGRIFVLRPNGVAVKRIPFNYGKVIAADAEHENFVLQPGDIVVVP
ncbi:MAG: sugar ABC transporter substrate-binding protein [Candidatus Rokuibacteriota bacterium]|nr:MAG: sugar ABC transporter substrate-binding protein [Candidatus Rokubacteria bacterium]